MPTPRKSIDQLALKATPESDDLLHIRDSGVDKHTTVGGLLGVVDGAKTQVAFTEVVGPVGVANQAIVFAKDNGAGKTQLCVQFPTGAPVVIATEP